MGERTDLTKDVEEIGKEGGDETDQIRERIEETRQEMGETIQAIEEKLSLENISEQVSEQISEKASELFEAAKDNVYSATIGKAGKFMQNVNKEIQRSGILEKAVANPLPLFLIAFGAGLLIFKSKNGRKSNHNGNERRNLSGATNSGNLSNDSSTLKNAQEKIESVGSSLYQSAEGAANTVYETVGDFAGNTAEKVENLGIQVRDSYDYYIEENPLAVGAVALAAGALVGLAIPSTGYENEMLGETRQNLISKAQHAAKETIQDVKNVAGETVNSVKKDVVEKVQQVTGNAADTFNTEVKKQGLG